MRRFRGSAFCAIVLAFGLVQPAQAQLVQIAICAEGGCTCHVTGQTLADVEMTLGVPAPPGAETMTLVTHDNTYSWRTQTPRQIDASFGGSGDCPIQLEPPLIPEDGLWRMTAGATDASACPLDESAAIAKPDELTLSSSRLGAFEREVGEGHWVTLRTACG